MIRPFVLGILVAIAGTHAIFAAATPQRKPNILFFLVDDLGWQDTAIAFDVRRSDIQKYYRTPNLQRLAQQGVQFTSAYAQPVCTPSRVSMISGMNSARSGVTFWTAPVTNALNEGTLRDTSITFHAPRWNRHGGQPETATNIVDSCPFTPLPALLKQGGYYTIHCGKAHFAPRDTPGADPLNLGYDLNIGGCESSSPIRHDTRTKNPWYPPEGSQKYPNLSAYLDGKTHLTDALTHAAMDALERWRTTPSTQQKPFYLALSHYAVHTPLHAHLSSPFASDESLVEHYTSALEMREAQRKYATMVEGMDASLGALMRYLHTHMDPEGHPLAENTVIVFFSDNGGHAIENVRGDAVNYPLRDGKGSRSEGGIRVPLVIHWPGVTTTATTCKTPVICEDLFSTILALSGSPKKTAQTVDGVDLTPLLRGEPPADLHQRPLLFHTPHVWAENTTLPTFYPSTALIQGDYKLIYCHIRQTYTLFNLRTDIGETTNLAEQEPQQLALLKKSMCDLLTRYHAQMPEVGLAGKPVQRVSLPH